MADLQFVDQYNMVACLERTDGNAEFHQILDFLTTSSIHYALTISPTIYASYIEQFWATAKSKTVNDVKQIHVAVDGKTVVISKSSVRSELHFNDKDGITCLSNDEIFVNLALMGFERVYTELTFQKAFFPLNRIEGEGSGQPTEPQPPSSTTPPSQVTTVTSQPQKTHTPRRAKRGQDTKIPQSSGLPKKVGDEAVYIGEDDRVVRAATTATSLEAEQESGSGPRRQDTTLGGADAQTRFETASKKSHDPPLSEGNTSGSGEDSMEHQVDLTDFVPPTPHDSPLLGGHIPGSDEDCSRLGDPKAKKESQKIGKGTKGKNPRDESSQDCISKEKKGLDTENVSNEEE
ncbi:hypothetical protein Tco_0979167 [Tanacetum coccineum]